ncbi:MAG TPA: AEC family transporter [Coleofasciculaceae cyanobacterium]
MTDSLLQAYLPLLVWTGLGLFLVRFLPESLPRLLGRGLYWVGVPLEILALARQTQFSAQVGLAPVLTIATLIGGLGLAWLSLQAVRQQSALPSEAAEDLEKPGLTAVDPWQDRSRRGSFILSSIMGNTGFVGLAIAPAFVDPAHTSWLVLYSVTQNVVGTYGMGVFLASYYGRSLQTRHWIVQMKDVLTVPSLWAFAIGSATRAVVLPEAIDWGLQASVWVVIPAALLLMGMRVSQLRGWDSLKLAIFPTLTKVLVLPLLVALLSTAIGLTGDDRLALVLMAGMPSAFAGLILAEEYELDRELIASSIVLTTAMLLPTIPLWLALFG